MEQTLKGQVEHIIYKSQDGKFAVLEVLSEGGRVIAAGDCGEAEKGDDLEFFGEWTDHPTYGLQFSVRFTSPLRPETSLSILKFLSRGTIGGIGPATARKLVERFGDNTLNVIEEEPEKLVSVRGITQAKAQRISEEFRATFSAAATIMKLRSFSIGREESLKLYKLYGDSSADAVKENPYLICEETVGLSFEKAEALSEQFGLSADNSHRLSAGLLWVLRHNLLNGHTCLPKDKLFLVAHNLLSRGSDELETAFSLLSEQGRIVAEEDMVFIPQYYNAERYAARRLSLMLRGFVKSYEVTPKEIAQLEKLNSVTYDSAQKNAMEMALSQGLLILTGGPGTGKTTTINAIIKLMESRGLEIGLAAPTGRAAKRMQELCGREAQTIHRLLEVEWGEDERQVFRKNERDMLRLDALIVDEVSMVDSLLFEALLKALPMGCRLILVGDSDQLPSVGAGNILADMLESGMLPSVALSKVFRQAAQSLIVRNAHTIISGGSPVYNEKGGDFFLVSAVNPVAAARTVRDLVCHRLPEAYGFEPSDIQVLCPSRMLETGTVRLNNMIQQEVNPSAEGEPEITMREFKLRSRDRVMQIKNNYDIPWVKDNGEKGTGIFNGDIGVLQEIDPSAGTATVRFDDKTAEYFGDELAQLEPAYAVTVHKSQGSEYECVVIPILDCPQKLRYRNLLYTAITRAKKLLCIVGSGKVVEQMIANNRKTLRYTGLKNMIILESKEQDV